MPANRKLEKMTSQLRFLQGLESLLHMRYVAGREGDAHVHAMLFSSVSILGGKDLGDGVWVV